MFSIRIFPDEVLGRKAQPVSTITPAVISFTRELADTMYHHRGIGISAPQVGRPERIVVVDLSEKRDRALFMINPEITWSSPYKFLPYEESCMSLSWVKAYIKRPHSVSVAYTDLSGEKQEIKASGLLGQCLQHEIDHLNGDLFINHIAEPKRTRLLHKDAPPNIRQVLAQNHL